MRQDGAERIVAPAEPPSEFPRPIAVAAIPRDGLRRRLEATAAERAALAERFDLKDVEALSAEVQVNRTSDGRVRVRGTLAATVVQTCVVSLDPLPASIAAPFAASFAPPDTLAAEGLLGTEVVVTIAEPRLGEEDDPEPFLDGDRIDLGELVAQHLSLALDPYPRKPNAALADAAPSAVVAEDSAPTDERAPERPYQPFATLADRLRRDGT